MPREGMKVTSKPRKSKCEVSASAWKVSGFKDLLPAPHARFIVKCSSGMIPVKFLVL